MAKAIEDTLQHTKKVTSNNYLSISHNSFKWNVMLQAPAKDMCSCKISILFLWKKILIYNYESMIRRSWPTYDMEKFKQYLFRWHFIYLKLQIDQQNLKYSYTKGITKMDKTFAIKYVITVHMPNWCHVPNSSHARNKVCKNIDKIMVQRMQIQGWGFH